LQRRKRPRTRLLRALEVLGRGLSCARAPQMRARLKRDKEAAWFLEQGRGSMQSSARHPAEVEGTGGPIVALGGTGPPKEGRLGD
jgi:hypothetical protein